MEIVVCARFTALYVGTLDAGFKFGRSQRVGGDWTRRAQRSLKLEPARPIFCGGERSASRFVPSLSVFYYHKRPNSLRVTSLLIVVRYFVDHHGKESPSC